MQSDYDKREQEFAELAARDDIERDYARDKANRMKEYILSLAHTFQQVDSCTAVGLIMWEHQPYIATLYRTVDNLADDGWSLDASRVVYVASEEVVDDALAADWVCKVKFYEQK